jgi:hypothetical protein
LKAREETTSESRTFVTLCGRVFRDADPRYFPCAQYHGRTIYFCTEFCLNAFLSDPDLFYKVHKGSNIPEKNNHA